MEGLDEAAFAALLRGSDDLILVIDHEGRILDAGAQAKVRLAPKSRLPGAMLTEFLSGKSGRALLDFLDALGTDGAITVEHVAPGDAAGEIRRVRYAVHAIPYSGRRRHFLLVGREVPEPDQTSEVPGPAARDPLTGLANRAGLETGLARLWADCQRDPARPRAWVLMADIDHFKAINDTHGHAAGDAVLAAVARVLGRSVRDADLVARYGGDEFLLAGRDGATRDVEAIAARMVEAVRTLHVFRAEQQEPLRVTISAGAVLVLPGLDLPPGVAVEAADRALYRAKHEGRDRAVVEPGVLGG